MCYWVLTVLVKCFARAMLQHVIHTNLIDPDMKLQIEKFGEQLEKHLHDTKFVDDFGSYLYIDDVDEDNEASHGDRSDTLSDEAYGGNDGGIVSQAGRNWRWGLRKIYWLWSNNGCARRIPKEGNSQTLC